MKVLVVDDNDHNREYARQVLSEGWTVELAPGGAEALAQIAAGPPSLLLLDLSMPEVDGWEVLRQLRGGTKQPSFAIVACSAHAMAGDKERALAAGFDAYLTKPYRPQELLEMVSSFLGAPAAASDGEDDGWGGDDWALDGEDWGE